MSPCRKLSGTNTATSTRVVAITAKAIWRVPRKAATRGVSPSSCMRRWMFSSTTMASSTISPMASTRASRVSRLMVKPSTASAAKLPIRAMGTVTAGIRVVRTLPRNRKIATTTRPMAMNSVCTTCPMAPSTNTEASKFSDSSMPSGRVACRRSISAWAPLEISSTLAVDCFINPSPTIGTPLPRKMVRSSTAPISTRATSPRRTR